MYLSTSFIIKLPPFRHYDRLFRSSAGSSSSRRPGWAVPRHFTPYHHQAAQIRHHKPSFDIRGNLNVKKYCQFYVRGN